MDSGLYFVSSASNIRKQVLYVNITRARKTTGLHYINALLHWNIVNIDINR